MQTSKLRKAKKRIPQKLYSMLINEEVEVVSMGHFPTTLIVKRLDGEQMEVDSEYLATLKKKEK